MCGKERLLAYRDCKLLVGNFDSPEISNPYRQFPVVAVPIHIKAYITGRKIHLHILHSLFFQVSADGKCTIGTIHSFYFPLNFFHMMLFVPTKHKEQQSCKITSSFLVATLLASLLITLLQNYQTLFRQQMTYSNILATWLLFLLNLCNGV